MGPQSTEDLPDVIPQGWVAFSRKRGEGGPRRIVTHAVTLSETSEDLSKGGGTARALGPGVLSGRVSVSCLQEDPSSRHSSECPEAEPVRSSSFAVAFVGCRHTDEPAPEVGSGPLPCAWDTLTRVAGLSSPVPALAVRLGTRAGQGHTGREWPARRPAGAAGPIGPGGPASACWALAAPRGPVTSAAGASAAALTWGEGCICEHPARRRAVRLAAVDVRARSLCCGRPSRALQGVKRGPCVLPTVSQGDSLKGFQILLVSPGRQSSPRPKTARRRSPPLRQEAPASGSR